MTKLRRALFKRENKPKNWLRKLMHNFVVHSNERAGRKSERLGLEQVVYFVRCYRAKVSGTHKTYFCSSHGNIT